MEAKRARVEGKRPYPARGNRFQDKVAFGQQIRSLISIQKDGGYAVVKTGRRLATLFKSLRWSSQAPLETLAQYVRKWRQPRVPSLPLGFASGLIVRVIVFRLLVETGLTTSSDI